MKALFAETRKTLRLAFPIMVGQLGQMLLGLADTLMVGRVGTVELAAVAFVNVLVTIAIVVGIGLSAAVSVQVSHAHGAEDAPAASEILRHGLLLCVAGGMLMGGVLLALTPFLWLFHQPAEVIAITPPYLAWVAASMAFMMPTMVIKAFAEAKNHPWPVFGIQIAGVLLNVALNRVFIFGLGSMPAWGLTGAGFATFLARLATLAAIWGYLRGSRTLAGSRPVRWLHRLDPRECRALLRLAAPIAGGLTLEFGAFALGALLIGQFGSIPLAAHQIAITCAATTYMFPLGISIAVSIRMGHSMGGGNATLCRRIVLGAHAVGILIMGGFALAYIFGGQAIAAAFNPDPTLVALAVRLLVIAAIFQLFDGIQIISMGGLRGLRDVHVPALLIFVSYWMLALPLGSYLGFHRGQGAVGLWVGLALGIAVAAAILSLRLSQRLRRLA